MSEKTWIIKGDIFNIICGGCTHEYNPIGHCKNIEKCPIALAKPAVRVSTDGEGLIEKYSGGSEYMAMGQGKDCINVELYAVEDKTNELPN